MADKITPNLSQSRLDSHTTRRIVHRHELRARQARACMRDRQAAFPAHSNAFRARRSEFWDDFRGPSGRWGWDMQDGFLVTGHECKCWNGRYGRGWRTEFGARRGREIRCV